MEGALYLLGLMSQIYLHLSQLISVLCVYYTTPCTFVGQNRYLWDRQSLKINSILNMDFAR